MPFAFAAIVCIELSRVIMAIVIVTMRAVQLFSEVDLPGSEGLRGMKVDHNKLQIMFCQSLCSLCVLLADVFATEGVMSRSTG